MKRNHMKNEGIGYLVFMMFNYLFMIIVIVATLFPYLNVLAKALNDGIDGMRGGITLWPRVFTLENFKLLLKDSDMYRATVVSVCRVVLQVVLSLVVQLMAAYALSRKELFGRMAFNVFFLIPMFVGAGLIPSYILFSKLKLLNTFWIYIIPGLFSFYNVMIIRSYIACNIPNEIIESARIDGCSEWRMLFMMIIPLSMPVLATIALWVAVSSWNDWTTTLYYIQKSSLHTLQYKLMQTIKETERINSLIQTAIEKGQDVESLQNSIKVTPESVQSAQVIIVTLPIIAIYPFLQKYFVKGVTLGAVKG